jgi:putative flippase GtrA
MTRPFIRFLLVGVCNTIIGLSSMFLFLHVFHISYWISTFLGNTIGAIASYFLNRKFTFNSHTPLKKSAFKFILVILVCYFCSYKLGIILANMWLGQISLVPAKYANDIAIMIGTGLYTITNYLGQRYIVFPKPVLEDA